jgi:hypothetical protein
MFRAEAPRERAKKEEEKKRKTLSLVTVATMQKGPRVPQPPHA